MTQAHHRQFHRGAGIALQQRVRGGQRHIARGRAVDALDDVAISQAGLGGGRVGNGIEHAQITGELLRENQAHVRAMRVLGLQVILVLMGIQIAREGIHGFQHSVERAQRHRLHVGLLDVLFLDVRHHFAEHFDVLISVGRLVRALPQHHSRKEKRTETHRARNYGPFHAAIHRCETLSGGLETLYARAPTAIGRARRPFGSIRF